MRFRMQWPRRKRKIELIAAIYGVEDRAIVMEQVEGPPLADRIAKGPIPFEEVIVIARQRFMPPETLTATDLPAIPLTIEGVSVALVGPNGAGNSISEFRPSQNAKLFLRLALSRDRRDPAASD